MPLRQPGAYIATAWRYQADVIAKRIPACRWVRKACQRNARDLKAAKKKTSTFVFDEAAAERVCQAAEQFPHIKGPKAKMVRVGDAWRWQTLELEPWQCWIIVTFFGWMRRATGKRRFRIGLILVPRKNGKSTLTAPIGNYMLTSDGESGAEVFSAATKKDQARIVFGVARQMAIRSPDFRNYFGVLVSAHQMEVEATASKFEPLSSDANSLDGLNPSCALVDELHAHRTRDVWDVLESALGSRDQPVLWAISTAGKSTGGICHELWLYAQKILDGTLEDDSFFAINYTVDDADLERWDAPEVQRKANPNYGVSVSEQYLRDRANKARHSPAARNDYLIKHLNVWVNAASPWMSMTAWARCARPTLSWDDFAGAARCVVAVDLAEKRDIASIVAVAQLRDGRVLVKGRHFLPALAIESSPIAQISGWVHSGWLTAIEGDVHDFSLLEEEIVEIYHLTGATEVCFDRALAAHLMQNLQGRLGHEVIIEVPQNVKTFNPAMKEVDRLVTAGQLQHPDDPVLTWCISNVAEKRNHLEESVPQKAGGKDSPNKIDAAVALLMGQARLLVTPEVSDFSGLVIA